MIKISKKLLLFFSIATAVIYFASCEKYSYVEEMIIPEDTIFFSKDIQPIFNAKCASCHNGTIPLDLRAGNSYKVLTEGGFVKLPIEESVLYKYVVVESSHAAYTSQEEKGKIYAWIDQGAEDN